MQHRSKRVGPYCRSQFSTLFLVLSGKSSKTVIDKNASFEKDFTTHCVRSVDPISGQVGTLLATTTFSGDHLILTNGRLYLSNELKAIPKS